LPYGHFACGEDGLRCTAPKPTTPQLHQHEEQRILGIRNPGKYRPKSVLNLHRYLSKDGGNLIAPEMRLSG